MKVFSSKDIIKILQADGWVLISAKGSHHHFKHPTKSGRVTVPHPYKEMAIGTVRNIFKQGQIEIQG